MDFLSHHPVRALFAPKAASVSAISAILASSSSQPLARLPEEQEKGLLTMGLPNNLSVYWVCASSIAVWFLFVHSPPFIVQRKVYRDFPLATHMAGAYAIYLSCMFNTLLTPSTLSGKARPWHVWVGRIGMVSGLISFGFGLYCAWWPHREVIPPLGFSVGITIGGVAQILTQVAGYRAIRKFHTLKDKLEQMEVSDSKREELDELKEKKDAALRTHIYNMVGLFVAACGIPAGIRIADMLPESMGIFRIVGVIFVFQMIIEPFGDTFVKKKGP